MAKLTIIAAAVFIAFAATSHNAKANGFESGYQLGGDCLAGFGNGSMTNDSYAKGGILLAPWTRWAELRSVFLPISRWHA